MKLTSHLSISHVLPVVVVALALGLTLVALVRISVVLTTLTNTELEVLRDEGELHRRAWALDVSMRHAGVDCRMGRPPNVELIQTRASQLGELLRREDVGPLTSMAERYLETASDALRGDVCAAVTGGPIEERRTLLDEELTNILVLRLRELHEAVGQKEDLARTIAVKATWIGIPLALAALLLATFAARRMARFITDPLQSIARVARGIGGGDLHASVDVDGPAEIVALGQDLEQMRRQLLQVDGLKQGFVASVSHELRTPLSKIREALALLEDGAVGPFDARQLRVIRIARSACEQEIRLVTTLLDLSRLRAGSPLRFIDDVSVDTAIQAALSAEGDEATFRGVALVTEFADEAVQFRMDPILLERAVANLVRNAISVSRRGTRVVVARSLGADAAGRALCFISVTDEGPGVPLALRESIFEPFVSHGVENAKRALGTGLGLALAREVARAHGGDLHLAQSSASGSTFTMTLPLDAQERREHAGRAERLELPA